jgi:hypothetical protein
LLQQPPPRLHKGKDKLETISKAPTIVHHYAGELASWDVFQRDVLAFYADQRTSDDLERCAHAPIYMDPAIESLNSKAMTIERLQTGAEISLSGRFFWNILAAVVHIVETLTNPQHGDSPHPNYWPSQLTFGDSWIIEKPFRVEGQQPDVVLKLLSAPASGHKIRLVGELKFCVAEDFNTMIKEAEQGFRARFCAILGMFICILTRSH